MANTKQNIISSFIKLASKLPFKKITVKKLVEECGINRATFYYHFSDTYSILRYLCDSEVERISSPEYTYERTTDGFLKAAAIIIENRQSFINIYNSIGRDEIQRYVEKPVECIVWKLIVHNTEGLNLSEEKLNFAKIFFTQAILGMLFKWLKEDEKIIPNELRDGIDSIINGGIRSMLESMQDK